SLLVRVSGRLCALPLPHVIETMRRLPVDAFPGAPGFVRGVAMIRGLPTPVVEAARLPGVGDGPGARRVTLAAAGRQVALAVAAALGGRVQARGTTIDDYLAWLESTSTDGEVAALARELTVGETSFFRNIEQFHALSEVVVPDLAGRAARPRPLRILSAGCAS